MNSLTEYAVGDVVSVRFAGVLRHYGVVTLGGRVISNSGKAGGVIEQSLAAFADGRPLKHHRNRSGRHGLEVDARARRALGATYDLTGSNCIDLTRWTHRRRPTPWQVGAATFEACRDMFGRRR